MARDAGDLHHLHDRRRRGRPAPPRGCRPTSAGRGPGRRARARRCPRRSARRPTKRRLWAAPSVSMPVRASSSAPARAGSAAASKTKRVPDPRAISRACPSRPKPVTSVAARTPSRTRSSAAPRFSVAMLSIAARGRHPWLGTPLPPAAHEEPGTERLGQQEPVADLSAALAQDPVGVHHPGDRQPVLRLGVADRVTAGEDAAGLADLRRGALEDRGERVPRQLLGECRDRQREQHPAAHREHVGQRIGRGDLPVRPGSSTSGGKKSSVPTIASSSLMR